MRLPLFLLLAAAAGGCSSGDPGPDPSPEPTRAWRMGFAALPPRIDQDVAVQSLLSWSSRADIAIVHEELPWTELIAGTPPDTILRREKDGLIEFYRGRGFRLVFVADANDGLAREREAPRLRALGRSLTEPAIQRLYRDWIVAFVRRYHPEYVGLAAETNLIRVAAPGPLYDAVVAVAAAAAADLRALPAPPALFVSVQVEVAWGRLGGQPYQGIEIDFADFPFLDLLGLSSYPYFGWSSPGQLPDDYYRRLLGGRSLPVMVVEGGWASGSGPGFGSSEAIQADYFRRQVELLSEVDAVGWLQLTPTDIDLTGYPTDLRDQLAPFGTLGVLDVALRPKLALRVWDSAFARERR